MENYVEYWSWRKIMKKKLTMYGYFVGTIYEVYTLSFNLFVIDMSLGALFELANADLNTVVKKGLEEDFTIIASYSVSVLLLIGIVYEFYDQFLTISKIRFSQQAKQYFENKFKVDSYIRRHKLQSI